MGRSTPTTAFNGAIWYFAYTIKTHWTYAWRSLVGKKIFLTKWQLWELRQLFPYMAFVYAWIVPLWADQLLPQLLMEQFDTLPIQCRHIEHMQEGVYNFCLHSFYWNLFKTKVKFFHLLLLCGGYLISIAYWLFSFTLDFILCCTAV